VSRRTRPAYDPWRDVDGTPIPVGTVALRRKASSPRIKVARQTPQTPLRTVTNRAYGRPVRDF
jgi:hypothetical protein